MATIDQSSYLMGMTPAETERLTRQARVYEPVTRHLFAEAGLTDGMCVLELGSGAGDVALLAADMVGPRGRVIGVERNPTTLAVARERAKAVGCTHVRFVEADLQTFEPDAPVDAIIGRHVLMYVSEPSAILRRLAGWLRPGGIVAVQEVNFAPVSMQMYPVMPTWQRLWAWMLAAVGQAGTEPLMGYKLASIMTAAGLPAPRLWFESPLLAGPDPTLYDWAADTLRSMLPLTIASGAASAAEVEIDTLGERLRAETLAHNGVVKSPDVVSAWTRLPNADDERPL
jgi:ubiquinone/menaquinone biosynthesis C-methylase UbiE